MESMESKPLSPRSLERREFNSKSLLMILQMTFEGKTRKEMNETLISRFGAPSFEKSLNPYKCRLLKFAFGVFRANTEYQAALKQQQQHLVDENLKSGLTAAFAADFKSVQWTEEEKTQIIEYGRLWSEHNKNKHATVLKDDAAAKTVDPRPSKRSYVSDEEEHHQQRPQPSHSFFPPLRYSQFPAQQHGLIWGQYPQLPQFIYFSSPSAYYFPPPHVRQDPNVSRS